MVKRIYVIRSAGVSSFTNRADNTEREGTYFVLCMFCVCFSLCDIMTSVFLGHNSEVGQFLGGADLLMTCFSYNLNKHTLCYTHTNTQMLYNNTAKTIYSLCMTFDLWQFVVWCVVWILLEVKDLICSMFQLGIYEPTVKDYTCSHYDEII